MHDEQVEACDVTRGDVVVFDRHRRTVQRVDPCASTLDLHFVWVETPVPLCIRPSALVTVRRNPLEASQ